MLTESSSILASLGGVWRSEGGFIFATASGKGWGGSGEGVLAFAVNSSTKQNDMDIPLKASPEPCYVTNVLAALHRLQKTI